MNGIGKITYTDGTVTEGNWSNNKQQTPQKDFNDSAASSGSHKNSDDT